MMMEETENQKCLQEVEAARSTHSSGYDSHDCSPVWSPKSSQDQQSSRKTLEDLELEISEGVLENMEVEDPTPLSSQVTIGVGEGLISSQIEIEKLVGSQVLENIIESQTPIDTILSCMDGKVGAHRIVLAAASPFLMFLLKYHKLGEIATIVIPDIPVRIMTLILQLCYSGQVVFPPELEDQICEGMTYLMIGTSATFSTKQVRTSALPTELVENQQLSTSSQSASVIELPSTSSQSAAKLPSKEEKNSTVPVYVTTNCPLQFQDSETDTSTETESEDDDQETENKNLMDAANSVLTVGADTDCYHCTRCEFNTHTRISMTSHLKTNHGKIMRWEVPSSSDMTDLSFCPMCNIYHSSVYTSEDCLKKHNMARCYSCLGIFPAEQWVTHYETAHGVKSKYGLVNPCRWCDVAIAISKTGILIRRHAKNSHISKANASKAKTSPAPAASSVPALRRKIPVTNVNSTKTRGAPSTSTASSSKTDKKCEALLPRSRKVKESDSSGSLLPFLRQFQDNLNNHEASVGESTLTRKRKLDEHGNPLQLAKRTGVPVGKKRKMLLSTMNYKYGTCTLPKNRLTGKISINGIPKVNVLLAILPEEAVNCFKKTPKQKEIEAMSLSQPEGSQIQTESEPPPCVEKNLQPSEILETGISTPLNPTINSTGSNEHIIINTIFC